MGKTRATADPITKNCIQGWFARSDFRPNNAVLALTFHPRPDISSNVGFQARNCSTWPCGREGELNPGAAMCEGEGIRELNALLTINCQIGQF